MDDARIRNFMLRLLQHDLRQPDQVGITSVLPRQSVPAKFSLPADNLVG
jgi:hypothetical protein